VLVLVLVIVIVYCNHYENLGNARWTAPKVFRVIAEVLREDERMYVSPSEHEHD